MSLASMPGLIGEVPMTGEVKVRAQAALNDLGDVPAEDRVDYCYQHFLIALSGGWVDESVTIRKVWDRVVYSLGLDNTAEIYGPWSTALYTGYKKTLQVCTPH